MGKLLVYLGLPVSVAVIAPITANAREESRFAIDEYGWELMQSEGICTARAFFEGADGPALVELRKRTPSDSVEALVTGAGLSKPANVDHRLADWKPAYRLTSAEAAKEISTIGWLDDQRNKNGAIFRLAVGRITEADDRNVPVSSAVSEQIRADRFAEIEGIYLDKVFRNSVVLETGPISEMMKLMDACTDKIVEGWGISPGTYRSLSRQVHPANLEDMARKVSARYPDMLQDSGTAEIVDVRLMVDVQGSATDCVANPGANRRFAEPTCRILMAEARFEPALDAEGTPVASYYLTTVIYTISGP